MRQPTNKSGENNSGKVSLTYLLCYIFVLLRCRIPNQVFRTRGTRAAWGCLGSIFCLSIKQTINQPPINQLIDRSIDQSINQSIYQVIVMRDLTISHLHPFPKHTDSAQVNGYHEVCFSLPKLAIQYNKVVYLTMLLRLGVHGARSKYVRES